MFEQKTNVNRERHEIIIRTKQNLKAQSS